MSNSKPTKSKKILPGYVHTNNKPISEFFINKDTIKRKMVFYNNLISAISSVKGDDDLDENLKKGMIEKSVDYITDAIADVFYDTLGLNKTYPSLPQGVVHRQLSFPSENFLKAKNNNPSDPLIINQSDFDDIETLLENGKLSSEDKTLITSSNEKKHLTDEEKRLLDCGLLDYNTLTQVDYSKLKEKLYKIKKSTAKRNRQQAKGKRV